MVKASAVSIAYLGLSVLRKKCTPVTPSSQGAALQTARKLVKYLSKNPAGGLSAPQIHDPIRMFVMPTPKLEGYKVPFVTTWMFEVVPKVFANYSVMINPKIVAVSETILRDYEACISIPDRGGCVPRHEWIDVEYEALKGLDSSDTVPMKHRLSHYAARIYQHEMDHMDGILFTDRVEHPHLVTAVATVDEHFDWLAKHPDPKVQEILKTVDLKNFCKVGYSNNSGQPIQNLFE